MSAPCFSRIPCLSRFTLLLSLPWFAANARAQVAANPFGVVAVASSANESGPASGKQDVVELSPFMINSTLDRGYQAQSTLGVSRLSRASDGTLLNYRCNAPLEWIVTTKFSF
ncbi:MAG: hypothetical protein WCQ89_23645 [Verrucomicrobiota bacterium]